MDDRTGLPTVGMVGAGQLARMVHEAAGPLGLSLRVLADTSDDGAALITRDFTVGDYRSIDDLLTLAHGCDVVTWDHEHVPNDLIDTMTSRGCNVQPSAKALRFAQDKAAMRHRLTEMGIPCPRWIDLDAGENRVSALTSFAQEVGFPLILKAARGGYDGKGVWVVNADDDVESLIRSTTPLIAEELVPIARELAAVVARSPSGQIAAWPIVETVQRDGICVEVIAPAPSIDDVVAYGAQQIALRIAEELDVTGVLAVELFETRDGRLVVNELAMRPHNSAHWTIEGAATSQFEQHLRAVLDLPLGATNLRAPHAVMVNILSGPDDETVPPLVKRVACMMQVFPDVKIHLYGKRWRAGRKVGHVTALGTNLDETRQRAAQAGQLLRNGTLERTQ